MIFKIWCLGGVKGYVRDPFNIFDGTLVIISLVDVLLTAFVSGSGLSVVTAFRTLRLLRVLKLATKSDNL
jgi:hypothetical protein